MNTDEAKEALEATTCTDDMQDFFRVGLVRELVSHLEELHSWVGLMSLLDEHWPEDIFPTQEDTEQRDPGPRIVSLIRTVDLYRKSLDMAHHETADEILRANEAERQRDKANTEVRRLRGFIKEVRATGFDGAMKNLRNNPSSMPLSAAHHALMDILAVVERAEHTC